MRRVITIAQYELRQRRRSVAWIILMSVTAFVMLLVSGFTIAALSIGEGWPEESGFVLYSVVTFFSLLLILCISPAFSGNAINGDRENATLATIQVTQATTNNILWGKLLAAIATGSGFIIVALPFLIGAAVIGKMPVATWLTALAILCAEVVIVSAIGVAISGLVTRSLFSVVITYLVIAMLSIGTVIFFILASSVDRVTITTHYRSYVNDSAAQRELPDAEPVPGVDPDGSACGSWQTDSYQESRTDRTWWLLAPNPFVILADATPKTFDSAGNAVDLTTELSWAVRSTQLPPETEVEWDDCAAVSEQAEGETAEEVIDGTVPSWWAGLTLQIIVAGVLILFALKRTDTPAKRMPPGTRVA